MNNSEENANTNILKLQHIATKNAIRGGFTAKYDYDEKIRVADVVAIINGIAWEDCTLDQGQKRPK